jgi:hypothetical protein
MLQSQRRVGGSEQSQKGELRGVDLCFEDYTAWVGSCVVNSRTIVGTGLVIIASV